MLPGDNAGGLAGACKAPAWVGAKKTRRRGDLCRLALAGARAAEAALGVVALLRLLHHKQTANVGRPCHVARAHARAHQWQQSRTASRTCCVLVSLASWSKGLTRPEQRQVRQARREGRLRKTSRADAGGRRAAETTDICSTRCRRARDARPARPAAAHMGICWRMKSRCLSRAWATAPAPRAGSGVASSTLTLSACRAAVPPCRPRSAGGRACTDTHQVRPRRRRAGGRGRATGRRPGRNRERTGGRSCCACLRRKRCTKLAGRSARASASAMAAQTLEIFFKSTLLRQVTLWQGGQISNCVSFCTNYIHNLQNYGTNRR